MHPRALVGPHCRAAVMAGASGFSSARSVVLAENMGMLAAFGGMVRALMVVVGRMA